MDRARRFVAEYGFAVVAVDAPGHGDRPDHEEFTRIATVPEWQAVLDAVQRLTHVGAGPVGYWGVSLGCAIGVPLVAAEPRVRAAVLGLGANPGHHGEVPAFEIDSTLRFFARHLG